MSKRIIEVTCCETCPYFQQTDGFRRVWVCKHQQFRGGINDPRRKDNVVGRINKDGSYPKFANKQVARGCPLILLEEPKVVKNRSTIISGYFAMIDYKLHCFESTEEINKALIQAGKKRNHIFINLSQYDPQEKENV